MKRYLAISLAAVCLLALVAGVAVRRYLRSQHVAQQVTTHLEALYGGPVKVGEVDVGLGSTSIKGFALYEEGGDRDSDAPWLKIAALTIDVSLWDLVNGNATPSRVACTGATLVFRFDRAGNLITRFPEAAAATLQTTTTPTTLPEADVEQAEVIFRKEGQPELAVKNVNLKLTPETGRWALTGGGDSPELGKISVAGSVEKESNVAVVHLKNEVKARVTQAILDRVPFVPAGVWDEVRIESAIAQAEMTV